MYYRKIINEINEWKESQKIKRRALIIKGLRQVGKTTTVKDYCNKNYDNVVYINFMENNSFKKIFDNDLIVDDLIRDLSAAIPESVFVPGKTVIVFDELQECANARASIKPFMIDGRFDVIGTGSLLGLRGYNMKKTKSVPTGFEYCINMYPMDFEEYILARGIKEDTINYVKDCFYSKNSPSESINSMLMSIYKEYLCVGGMPDAVATFLATRDLNQVRRVQRSLLEQYKDDFGKHLDDKESSYIIKNELSKIMDVFNSIPNQLSKENKKFQYSEIKKSAKGREYRFAINWLEEFGLISICNNLRIPELPLEGNKKDDEFKVYVSDTGLFLAMLDEGSANNVINGDLKIYKGAIFENIIADSFIKNGKKLYYYSKQSGMEIDFVTRYEDELYLIEVKSKNGNAKSLKEVLTNKEKYFVEKAIKLIDGSSGMSNGIYTIPLYMAFLIR